MIVFTDAVASVGAYEAFTGACAAAAAANTKKINAPSAAVRIFNFDYTDREKLVYSVGPFLNCLRSSSSPSPGRRAQLSASHRVVTLSDSAVPPVSTAQVRLLIVV